MFPDNMFFARKWGNRVSITLWLLALIFMLPAMSPGGMLLSHSLAITDVYTTAGDLFQANPTQGQLVADESSGTAYIYRVSVYSTMSGLDANQAYAAEWFNLSLGGNVSRVPAHIGNVWPNWLPLSPSDGFDINGNPVLTLMRNEDTGISHTDLQAIQTGINADGTNYNDVYNDPAGDEPIIDNRLTYANPGPTALGSIDVLFPGTGWGSISLTEVTFSIVDTNPADSAYMLMQSIPIVLTVSGGDAQLNFGVPEPTTTSLLAMGALSSVLRRFPRPTNYCKLRLIRLQMA